MEVQVQPHARTQTAIICVIRLRALSADTEDVRYASSNVLDSAQKKRIIIPGELLKLQQRCTDTVWFIAK
jgi:hypothetical protein